MTLGPIARPGTAGVFADAIRCIGPGSYDVEDNSLNCGSSDTSLSSGTENWAGIRLGGTSAALVKGNDVTMSLPASLLDSTVSQNLQNAAIMVEGTCSGNQIIGNTLHGRARVGLSVVHSDFGLDKPSGTLGNPAQTTCAENDLGDFAATFAAVEVSDGDLDAGESPTAPEPEPTDTVVTRRSASTIVAGESVRTVVLTWDDPPNITYGTELSAAQLNATASDPAGSAVAGAFAYAPVAGTVLEAGTSRLSAAFTAADTTSHPNSVSVPLSASIHVLKAPLAVTADGQTRPYGTANPALTATISGFAAGETLATSGVTGAPALATIATAASPVGTYPITVAPGTLAAANYTFSTFVAGTLTIVPATPTWSVTTSPNPSFSGELVTIQIALSGAPGAAPPAGTVTIAGVGSSTLAGGSATIATAPLAVGTTMFELQFAPSDGNYSASTTQVSQTVNPAPITLVIDKVGVDDGKIELRGTFDLARALSGYGGVVGRIAVSAGATVIADVTQPATTVAGRRQVSKGGGVRLDLKTKDAAASAGTFELEVSLPRGTSVRAGAVVTLTLALGPGAGGAAAGSAAGTVGGGGRRDDDGDGSRGDDRHRRDDRDGGTR